jgi:DNA-binding transcriptional ArsR family regulator
MGVRGIGQGFSYRTGLEAELMVEALQQRYREKNRRGAVSAFINAFQSIGEQSKLIRLVILVDESENILAFELGEDLRPNLRHLLTNSPIKRDIALVMAGSTKMYTKVKERDSPLENVFDHYLLHTLSREATLALARKPNADRLSEQAAEAIWEQTGGQPCMAQYILHELWYEFDGELQGVAAEDVYDIADTFDERTQHFATWAKTLDRSGDALYCFLIEQNAPVAYPVIRQHFYQMTQNILRGALDALVYHGLVHCHGEGRGRRYSLAGTMYRDWFLTAGHLNTPEQTEAHTTPAVPQVLIERVEQHMTTIAGSVIGPVAVGGGDAVDQRESQGPLYKPQNTVEQNFDKKEDKRK